ncbi:MAG: hypothetical protein LUE86_02465 [Clostridiales bacterium]|nr:hypothetical protein [Clostridiales bacterium]
MSRKNGKKNKDLHVVLPKIPELAVCRYTFDSWRRCYPGSSYRDYDNEQCPDNLMDSLALEFDSWSDEELEQYQDTRICPVLIDEDYFSWLGGRENTPDARKQYAASTLQDEAVRVRKLMDAGLLHSFWTYAFMADGFLHTRSMNGCLSAETVDALTAYVKQRIPDKCFDLYVVPHLIKMPHGYEDEEDFLAMAKDYFCENEVKPRLRYLDLVYQVGVRMFHVCIPFVIRETHETGSVTVGEVYDYMYMYRNRKLGRIVPNARNLNTLAIAEWMEDPSGLLPASKAGKLLERELTEKATGVRGYRGSEARVSHYLPHTYQLPDFYKEAKEQYKEVFGCRLPE